MINRFAIFTRNITVIYNGIQQLKKEYMKPLGLSGNSVMCLFHLMQNSEGLTASELCELVCVDKAAVSRSMSELFKKDCIAYPDFDGTKKYNTRAVLTEKGFRTAEGLNGAICTVVERLSEGVTDDDRTCMYRSLRTIANNLRGTGLENLLAGVERK